MTPRFRGAIGIWLVAMLLAACLSSCKSGGETTVLRGDDFNVATQKMAASLASSDFLRDRGPNSPPIIITIDKVENRTSDIIHPAEAWMLMARLQGSLPIQSLHHSKNIQFQIPPERELLVRDAGYHGELPPPVPATHLMSAVFRSSTRSVRSESEGYVNRREEYYTLQYQITSLDTREILWTDSFEFKREAAGMAID